MNVLIIGGTGNISSAITQLLLARGDAVTLYNRGMSSVSVEGGICVINGDRTDHAAFEAQMAAAECFDCVIDMITYHPEDAESVIRAFRGRTQQLILCSTIDVYTKPAAYYPIREDAPRHPAPSFAYAYDKARCERILQSAAVRGDFNLTILRPAATYNDSCCPISMIGSGATLLSRIRAGQPIIVLGDGSSLWVSSHRDDVAVAFAAAAGNPQTYGKSYHVTGDEWMTWEMYYLTIARVMGVTPTLFVRIPTHLLGKIAPQAAEWCVENFQFHTIFDNSAAKSELNFRYTISWEEGVRRMLAWHEAQGDINNSPPDPLYDRIVAGWLRLENNLCTELKVGA